MNALTGVMAANMDGIPLLVISGNEKLMYFDTPQRRGIGFQGFIPSRVVGSFTKWCISMNIPSEAMWVIGRACSIASEHRQGPVWVDIPQDIAAMEMP